MEYNWETAYKILSAMQNYRGNNVPGPDVELDEGTGLPPPPAPPLRPATELLAELNVTDLDDVLGIIPERPQIPQLTSTKSWIGEMDRASFLAHTLWLKEEKFITTRKAAAEGEHPDGITARGVQILKEIEAKGGWQASMAVTQAAGSPTTLTSMLAVLQKSTPRTR